MNKEELDQNICKRLLKCRESEQWKFTAQKNINASDALPAVPRLMVFLCSGVFWMSVFQRQVNMFSSFFNKYKILLLYSCPEFV